MSGIRLGKGDAVVGLAVAQARAGFFVVTNKGLGKRTPIADFPRQRRSGKGVQIAKMIRGERVAAVGMISASSRLMPVTRLGRSKTTTGRSVSERARATRGESIIGLQGKDVVTGVVVQMERIEGASDN
jgi:DNA gyrase subunit A